MVTPPDETPVTKPVTGSTVAMDGLLDDHTPPVVALANTVVDPAQIVVNPVIDCTNGNGSTVTVVFTELTHPLASVTV
jgi:hypothetical protein